MSGRSNRHCGRLPRISSVRAPASREFTPNLVIARDGAIRRVDRETAAVTIGEIDLAGFTKQWVPAIVGTCGRDYARARWRDRRPRRILHRYVALGELA